MARSQKPCPSCKGTGRKMKDRKGEKVGSSFQFRGIKCGTSGGSDPKGEICKRCYGKGVV